MTVTKALAQLEAGHNSTSPRKAQGLIIINSIKLYSFFLPVCDMCVVYKHVYRSEVDIRCLPQLYSTLFIEAISCWTQNSQIPDSVARLLQKCSLCLPSAGIIGSHCTYQLSFFPYGHWKNLNPKPHVYIPSTFPLSYLPRPLRLF